MRVSLLHGDNSPAAYEKYRQLVDGAKAKGFEIINISDIHDIVRQSLFDEKLVFTLEKPNKIKPNDWKWFKKNADSYSSNLLIYYSGNLPIGILRTLPKNANIQKFDLPKILFTFLDGFYPGNSKNLLKLLDSLTKNTAIELVFHLLSMRLRDLYWAKMEPESMTLADWQIMKISGQAKKFDNKKLQFCIEQLADIDVNSKTGIADLCSSLDIFIVKHLE